jgi:hypothetical protein
VAGRVRRTAIGGPGLLLQGVGALAVVFGLARAVWYPFWAAGAAQADLARSWGGPTAVGATLAHWCVAAALVAAGGGLFLLGRRWRRR